MISRRDLLCTAGSLALPLASMAGGYPQMPINLVIPLGPGDAADIAARLMGQRLASLLHVPVVSVNRPGAGGSIGTQSVIRAARDGYTMLFAQNSSLTIRRVLEPDTTNYDPRKDLTPLGLSTRTPSILVVRKDGRFGNFGQIIDVARKAAGTVRVGHAGVGSAGDISVQLVNSMAGVQMAAVPYKGAGPAVADLLGGHVDAVVLALGAVSAYLRSGTLRGLAISARYVEFADLPTLTRLGYPHELQDVWFAFFMPPAVPQSVTDVMLPALEQVARDPNIAAQLRPLGMRQEWMSAPKLSETIESEYRTVRDLVNSAPARRKP